MADDSDTIKEFVTKLGFKIDESQWGRFTNALEGATLRAKLFGDALEAMAVDAVQHVDQVSKKFEDLFYAQSRTLSDTRHIQAFQYAVGQMGGSIDSARTALENLGEKLRNQPGFEAFISKLGVSTRDANGHLRQSSDLLIDLVNNWNRQPPAMQKMLGEILGLDEKTRMAINRQPEFGKFYEKELESLKSAGLGEEAAKDAAKFEQAWRGAFQRMGDSSDAYFTQVQNRSTSLIDEFNKYVDDHKDKINEFVQWVSGANKPQATGFWGRLFDFIETATLTSGLFGDLSKSTGHFDADAYGKHVKGAIGEVEGEFGKLGSVLKPVVEYFERLRNFFSNWFGNGSASPLSGDLGPAAGSIIGGAGVSGGAGIGPSGLGPGSGGRGGGAGGRLNTGMMAAIKAAAIRNGIDPNVALRVAAAEGPGSTLSYMQPGDYGTSGGPFQLHRGGPGSVGTEYERQTGYSVFDASHLQDYLDFTMQWVRKHGWNAWSSKTVTGIYGNAGVGPMPLPGAPDSIRRRESPIVIPPFNISPATAPPVLPPSGTGGDKHVSSNITNNISVTAPEPDSAATMVGDHLDRTANDVYRNLQGAAQ